MVHTVVVFFLYKKNLPIKLHLLFLSSADFFHIHVIVSGTLSGCHTIWIQIRTDILSVLIWAQTVCKGNQLKSCC